MLIEKKMVPVLNNCFSDNKQKLREIDSWFYLIYMKRDLLGTFSALPCMCPFLTSSAIAIQSLMDRGMPNESPLLTL